MKNIFSHKLKITSSKNAIFKGILLVFSICIFNHLSFSQQRFVAGLKAGISTTQVSGDTYSGYNKAGIIAGGYVRAVLNEKWTGQMEMMYIQKGSRHNGNPDKGDYTYYYLGVNYIEVPLLFQYHQSKFTYEFGPSYNVLINSKETLNGYEVKGVKPFNTSGLSINIGASYAILNNLSINWRFSNSITPIRAHASGASKWYNPGQMNDVLAFTLNYTFGGSKSE